MRAVIDASALVAGLFATDPTGVWAESKVAELDLAGPELVLVESTNILRRLEHSGLISRLEATTALRDLVQIEIELFPFRPFADRVWSLRDNVTSYDAWYVAVAEHLGCPLLTIDRRLGNATGPACEVVLPPP